jgi:hypothetical protein
MPLYALTIFCGAFLLFLVQPLIGRYILPWFGGSPGVWTTCLLFFQTLLLGGYAYAHFTSTRLKPRTQATAHLVLLAIALLWLPIVPDVDWKPQPGHEPTRRILLLLTATLGLPYLLLSATGPLLQRWFTLTYPGRSPYRLYALSNVGSLLALLGYPFLIEPVLSRTQQAWGWSAALILFAALCGLLAWRVRKLDPPIPVEPEPSTATPAPSTTLAGGVAAETSTEESARPRMADKILWLLLPAIASTLLVASTNKICIDVAVIPFLWVLPLALYLLSFILAFDHPRWYSREMFSALFVVACAVVGYLLWSSSSATLSLQLVGYTAALFIACMICHGELYRMRPPARHLTSFYLFIAAGGALGGLFVAVVAPVVFRDYHELPLGLWLLAYVVGFICLAKRSRAIATGAAIGTLATAVLLPALMVKAKDASLLGWAKLYGTEFVEFYGENWAWLASVLAVILFTLLPRPGQPRDAWHPRLAGLPLALTAVLGAIFYMQVHSGNENVVVAMRNFYGTLKIRTYGEPGSVSHNYVLAHGITTHGMQFLVEPYDRWATSYYGAGSGAGLAMDTAEPVTGGRHIGVVGLGTGSLAAYGMPEDRMRIYEINPDVLTLARERFTYLSQTAAEVKIVMGDARLSMEDELRRNAAQDFDVLVLDAFSSDAIPIHLLTEEAFALYLQHLQPAGIIAVHISNRYLDLRPVVESMAKHFNLHLATISHNPSDDDWWLYRTTWMLLSRDEARLQVSAIVEAAEEPSDPDAFLIHWTDDRASLFGVLR